MAKNHKHRDIFRELTGGTKRCPGGAPEKLGLDPGTFTVRITAKQSEKLETLANRDGITESAALRKLIDNA